MTEPSGLEYCVRDRDGRIVVAWRPVEGDEMPYERVIQIVERKELKDGQYAVRLIQEGVPLRDVLDRLWRWGRSIHLAATTTGQEQIAALDCQIDIERELRLLGLEPAPDGEEDDE